MLNAPATVRTTASRIALGAMLCGAVPSAILVQAQAPVPVARLVEEMRIVSNDAATGTSLTPIIAGAVLADGRILTVHMNEAVIRVFDQNGRFVRMFGGKGDGPGEFRAPSRIGVLGDTIWIYDLLKSRYVFFAPDFTPVAYVKVPANGSPYLGPVSSTASILKIPDDTARTFGLYDAAGRLTRALPVKLRSSPAHFLIRIPSREGGRAAAQGPGMPRIIFPPVRSETSVSILPGGKELLILEPGDLWGGQPGQFTMQRMTIATGQTTAPVRATLPTRTIPRPKADSILDEFMKGRTELAPEHRTRLRVPEYEPPYDITDMTSDGLLLVLQGSARDTWQMIDNSGRVLMKLRIPDGLAVLAVSRTHLWGRMRDVNDLPIIVRYRIVI